MKKIFTPNELQILVNDEGSKSNLSRMTGLSESCIRNVGYGKNKGISYNTIEVLTDYFINRFEKILKMQTNFNKGKV